MRSHGDDEDQYDDSRHVAVGDVADKRKESAHRADKRDEDARAMINHFRHEERRLAMETLRSFLQSQYNLAEI